MVSRDGVGALGDILPSMVCTSSEALLMLGGKVSWSEAQVRWVLGLDDPGESACLRVAREMEEKGDRDLIVRTVEHAVVEL